MQLCCVGVNFGALGFVRFLGTLSFHLRGSGSRGENCSVMPWLRSSRMQHAENKQTSDNTPHGLLVLQSPIWSKQFCYREKKFASVFS